MRTHYSSDLSKKLVGQRVSVAGWVEDVRSLGSLLFMTIRDVSGVSQAVFIKDKTPPGEFLTAKLVTRQSAVIVQGVVRKSRAKGMEVEIHAERIHVLSSATPPLPIDPTGRVGSSLDTRIDARALDLRNPQVAAIFKVKHTTLQSIRRILAEDRFIEVNTPKIIGAAAEGGATLFGVDYFGKHAYLAQSPQLYKEQLTLSLDRVFEVSTYFRAEKSHTRRHLNEFVSVDIEAAFFLKEDVMKVAEEVVFRAIKDVLKECPKELKTLRFAPELPRMPFERITYSDAIRELERSGFKITPGQDLDTRALRRLSKIHSSYYFIVDWPTSLKPFYIDTKEEDKDYTESFDLMCGYVELASGGLRVSDGKKLAERIAESGLSLDSFSDHLKAFTWGMPVHSGWGLGLDRFVMVLTGRKNIRDVVLFPRDRLRLTP